MSNLRLVKNEFPVPDPVQVNQVALLEKAKKKFGEIPTFFGAYKNPIGIEIEVENRGNIHDYLYWNADDDGSLKHRGVEFISKPISGHNIDYALHERKLIFKEHHDWLWSHRCSIHVHSYVGNMSMHRLYLLVALYAIYEPVFFSLVDPLRKANPYCYPIQEVNPDHYGVGDTSGKYCALNVGTGIRQYNTIEFRHMHGTDDEKTIRRWIQLIVKLVKYSGTKNLENEILNLNTVSNYDQLTYKIFGGNANLFRNYDLKKFLENGVLWSKIYLLGK